MKAQIVVDKNSRKIICTAFANGKKESLADYKGTLLFVSHDRYFINKVATRIVKIENCELRSFEGNYDEYAAREN